VSADTMVFFTAEGNAHYTAGTVRAVKGKTVEVESVEDGQTYSTTATKCRVMGPTSLRGVEDMIQLQDLHEGSLLYNIAKRYHEKLLYLGGRQSVRADEYIWDG